MDSTVSNEPQMKCSETLSPSAPIIVTVPEEPGALLKSFANHVQPVEKSPEVFPDANRKLRTRFGRQQKAPFSSKPEVISGMSQRIESPVSQSLKSSSSPRHLNNLPTKVKSKEGGVPEPIVTSSRRIVPTAVSETPSLQRPVAFASASFTSPENMPNQQSSPLQRASTDVPTLLPALSVDELSERHVAALLHVWRDPASPPTSFLDGVGALLIALTPVPTVGPSYFPLSGPSLISYSRSVLRQLEPILSTMPAPLCELFNNIGIAKVESCTQALTTSFPTGSFTPQHPIPGVLPLVPVDTDIVPAIPRLRSNLEVVWDRFLVLHRKFRGDITTAQPGSLDQLEALRAVAALHPANADAFSARFVSFMTRSVRTPSNAPDRLRRLDERMRGGVGNAGGTGNDVRDFDHGSSSHDRSTSARSTISTSGVVLHRAPRLVRDAFAKEHPEQLFFLDFVTSVDSARLNTALTPRLTSGISWGISSAACATSSSAFTDAIVEARLFAKLLSAVQHSANWPHSAEALTGAAPQAAAAAAATLPSSVRALRAKPHAASWCSILDIARLIHDAVASREILAIIASLAVADSVIRLAAVDPVARDTQWYRDAITAVTNVSILDKDRNQAAFARILVGDLIATPGVLPEGGISGALETTPLICAKNIIVSITDARFLRAVIPCLDKLRQTCASVIRGHRLIPRSSARRITPLQTDAKTFKEQSQTKNADAEIVHNAAKTDTNLGSQRRSSDPKTVRGDEIEDCTLDLLQREFFARIDGRIRELVAVVAAANEENSLSANDAFLSVIKILYPETPTTIATVAADMCSRRVISAPQNNQHELEPEPSFKQFTSTALEDSFVKASLSKE